MSTSELLHDHQPTTPPSVPSPLSVNTRLEVYEWMQAQSEDINIFVPGTTIMHEGELHTIAYYTETMVHCVTSHGRVKYQIPHLIDTLNDSISDSYVLSFPA